MEGRTRLRVLDAVRASADPARVNELAQRLAVHPNTVRFHLDLLEVAGAVERSEVRSGGRGRPTAVYSATPVSSWPGHRDPVLLGRILIDAAATGAGVDAWEAGRRWGRKHSAGTGTGSGTGTDTATTFVREEIARHLDQTGFDPAEAPGADDGHCTRFTLRNCAFADFLGVNQQAVCALHAGMLEGTRESVDTDTSYRVELLPLVEPFACAVNVCERISDSPPDEE
ncbi:helix-turn-helix transcriptional regulator [Dietzia alimentaria]|uniref:helix-turn-helix transcriptional regulator n=1 Tax=Dietzia alimentaria TaxID=665550 RepID=UPI0013032240|nr:helix-turn-helix domain-containing protein [Dietzia alimentaria]